MRRVRPGRLGSVLVGASLLCACGSTTPPTAPTTPPPTQSIAPTGAPTPTASATPASFGSLTITGAVVDTLVVQSQVPCNQVQGLTLEGAGGTIPFQLIVTDMRPGKVSLSTAGTQVAVQLSGSTGAGARVDWAGGGGTGTGSITAPPSVAGAAPGTFTVDAVLPPVPGSATAGSEHVTGQWTCG